jgi:hypothetical protein
VDRRAHPIARAARLVDAAAMTLTANMKQRDLVRLSLLVCGERPVKKPR